MKLQYSVFQCVSQRLDMTGRQMGRELYLNQSLKIHAISQLRNLFKSTALSVGMALVSILPSYGQHNVHIKTNTLDQSASGAPIAGVVISKDKGDVVTITDANGEATLTNVDGTMSIKALHQDYKQFEQTFNITSDTTLYFAMPKNIRIGPWGTDTLNVEWYKNTFQMATYKDPPRWKQVNPITNRLAPGQYLPEDSLLVVDAINILEAGTGYDLITLVPSSVTKDTTYTIELNSYTNFSYIGYDINYITFAGNSKITTTDKTKYVIHEINNQFGMRPYPGNNVPGPGSVMDPTSQTMTDPMKWDFDHIALTMDESHRKKNGKQNLFLSNMTEYVALSNVEIMSIISPLNNAVDVDTLLNIVGIKDSNAVWYDYKITSDIEGNNVFLTQNGVDRPRLIVDLEPEKTYFLFERARNNTSTGIWSTPIQVTTKAKPILPSQAIINAPLTDAIKVETPVAYSINSDNATSFRIIAAKNSDLSQILKDTIVMTNNPNIPLPHGIEVYTQVFGINENGTSIGSNIIHYTTIKDNPTNSEVLTPINNATKVEQPVTFTNSTSINAEQYKWKIKKQNNQEIILDTIINNTNGFTYNKLTPAETYEVTVQPINSDVNGNESNTNTFTIIKDKPGVGIITYPTNNQKRVTQPINYLSETIPNAETCEWIIKDTNNITILDTLTGLNGFTYDKLMGGKTYKISFRGINSDQAGNFSPEISYTIIKDKPGAELVLTPTNNQTKVAQPFTYTNTCGANSETHRWQIREQDNTIKLDTIVESLQFIYDKLEAEKTYKTRVKGINTDQDGEWSDDNLFTIIKQTAGNTQITNPTNNQTKVTQPINFECSLATNTEQYQYLISDQNNNTILDTTLNTNMFTFGKLDPGKTYNIKARAKNSDTNGNWSDLITFTIIKNKPATSNITYPNNNQIKVEQPVNYTSESATNAEQYQYKITDTNNNTILDTTLNTNTFTFGKLEPGKTYNIKARAKNSDWEGEWAEENTFTIIKGTPNAIIIDSPTNNATEVNNPVNVTSTTGGQYAEGYKYEIKTLDDVAVFDTATLTNGFSKNLPGNRTFKVRGQAYNTDVEGTKSPWTTFTTYNNAPGNWSITEPVNNTVIAYMEEKFSITGTQSIDIDNDNVSKNYRIVGPNLDTLIQANNVETIYLDSAVLQPDAAYTLTGEATDGSKATQAENTVIFRTPKVTGINDGFVSILKLYPNPVHNSITVEMGEGKATYFRLDFYSLSGELLKTCETVNRGIVDISGLHSGAYLLKISSHRPSVAVTRLIIKQ